MVKEAQGMKEDLAVGKKRSGRSLFFNSMKTLVLTSFLCLTVVTAWAETITVGALYPLSGGLALLGEESFRGFELATEEVNANGGIQGGKKIVFEKGDAVDPNQAVGEARRLISVKDVPVIFGTYSSSRSFAASQVAELAGVPYFELGAISDPITEREFKYVFRTNPTAKSFAKAIVDAIPDAIAPKLGVKASSLKVAIIHEDSLYGTTVAGYQEERAKEKGLNIVEIMPYAANSVDLSSLILRLKGAGTDVVLQTSYMNDTVLFFRQMKEGGLKLKAIIGAGGGYSMQDAVDAVGAENMEGALNVDFTQYKTNPKAAPGINAFVEIYKAKYGTLPRSGHSLANYMGAKVIYAAMDKAGSMDKDAIRASIMKVDIPTGTTATGWGAKFGDDGQNTRAKPYLMQWQKGELVTVFPPAAAVAEFKIGVGSK
jgi:branched-chain amino acid transport system substrate-binding protein